MGKPAGRARRIAAIARAVRRRGSCACAGSLRDERIPVALSGLVETTRGRLTPIAATQGRPDWLRAAVQFGILRGMPAAFIYQILTPLVSPRDLDPGSSCWTIRRTRGPIC